MKLHVQFNALREAESDLGLTLPARVSVQRIRCSDPKALVSGRYHGIDVHHPAHLIEIHSTLTTTAASAALWHELTHAVQAERLGGWPHFIAEYERQKREARAKWGTADYFKRYESMPLEAEAWAATRLARAGAFAKLFCACDDAESCVLSGRRGKVVV